MAEPIPAIDFSNLPAPNEGILSAASQSRVTCAWMARRRFRRHRLETQSREVPHALTPDEKAYLLPFIIGGQNTLYFRAQDTATSVPVDGALTRPTALTKIRPSLLQGRNEEVA